jgi:hypothetical protein
MGKYALPNIVTYFLWISWNLVDICNPIYLELFV